MSIKINKKLVSMLLASTMTFSLVGCVKSDGKESNDSYTFDNVLNKVASKSISDEVFNDTKLSRVNPFTLEEVDVMTLDEAYEYLNEIVTLSEEINKIDGIKTIKEDNEHYDVVTDIASTWDVEDAYTIIDDIRYDNDAVKAFSKGRLAYYKAYLDKELRVNGINMAYDILDGSLRSIAIDANKGEIEDYSDIVISNNSISYNSNEEGFYNDEALALLSDLDNIRNNLDDFDVSFNFNDIVSIIKVTLDTSKDIIYNGGKLRDNTIKAKRISL